MGREKLLGAASDRPEWTAAGRHEGSMNLLSELSL